MPKTEKFEKEIPPKTWIRQYHFYQKGQSKMDTLRHSIITQMSEWVSSRFPRSIYVYGIDGTSYIRWTPAYGLVMEKFTIANINIAESYRRQGRFKGILESLCRTRVSSICVECVHNIHLSKYLNSATFPGRVARIVTPDGLPEHSGSTYYFELIN